jgi:ferredoxin
VRERGPELDAAQSATVLTAIRRFCLGEPGGGAGLTGPDAGWMPAALYPYRHQQAVRQDYPLFLVTGPDGVLTCRPIVDLLFELVEGFAPQADAAKALKDNLARLEVEVRAQLADQGDQVVAGPPTLRAACAALERKLSLKGEGAAQLHADLGRLCAATPEDGVFLPITEQASVRILLLAAQAEATRRGRALAVEIKTLRGRLRDLLATERARGDAGREGSTLAGSAGPADAGHFDAAAMSRVLGRVKRGEATDPARLRRIERAVEVLDAFLARDSGPVVHVVSRDEPPTNAAGAAVRWTTTRADPCVEAVQIFDSLAGERADLIAAIRTARLELARGYDPARHDALVASLDWRGFSKGELLLLPPVLAIESPDRLGGSDMRSLSQLLLSGRPVEVLVNVPAAGDPGSSDTGALTRYRLELAYLGIGHREALVNQTSAARPSHMLDGFLRGLGAMRASLHVVASGLASTGEEPRLGAWLHGGAALEGRAHPLFHYDPEAGETWARRLDFSMNPSAEEDWPACGIPHIDAAGIQSTIASHFTFADFALLEAAYHDEFRLVPDGLACPTLIDAAEYCRLDTEAAAEMIPFVWAADGGGVLRRLAFTRRLGFACRDRLGYWHTLQELAGVRNEYVLEAVRNERERLAAEFAAERERLASEHRAEVERVRTEAAGEALRRLAEGLVHADLSSLAGGALAPAAPLALPAQGVASAATGSPAVEPPLEPEAAEAEGGFDEPWIDSALCTSCNDCMGVNAQVFVYNANKQATIGDPKAGSFAQIVAAAEKCPARCIHPGKPLHPAETGLEQLIERAKPFN